MAKRISDNLIPRSEINEENKNWVAETYWNAIANADWAVGKVIESLKERITSLTRRRLLFWEIMVNLCLMTVFLVMDMPLMIPRQKYR